MALGDITLAASTTLGPVTRWEPDAEGRLVKASLELFDRQGYDATTVAEIAEHAGVTKRTFFRYFSDKREVLFQGAGDLEEAWLAGIAAAPGQAGPLDAVAAGFDRLARFFAPNHDFARTRAGIVAANPELQERELIKLQRLAGAIEATLVRRGVPENVAGLAAQAGVTVFHVAFARWVRQDDPAALRSLLDESLADLRVVTAAAPQTTADAA